MSRFTVQLSATEWIGRRKWLIPGGEEAPEVSQRLGFAVTGQSWQPCLS